MYTGKNNITNLGTIFSWNNSTSTEAYPGSCGQVRGSSDGLFPPGKTSQSNIISLFSTDLCRALHFVKHGQAELHGIPVNTFHLSTNNFANSSICPDNHCYNNNLPTGVQVSYPILYFCIQYLQFRMSPSARLTLLSLYPDLIFTWQTISTKTSSSMVLRLRKGLMTALFGLSQHLLSP